MVKIQKRTVKTNGHYELILRVKSNTWVADAIRANFKNENHEMAKRMLKVTCKELKLYFIANEDMINLQEIQDNLYRLSVTKYKKLP